MFPSEVAEKIHYLSYSHGNFSSVGHCQISSSLLGWKRGNFQRDNYCCTVSGTELIESF
jgi:hypothetical protein